MNRSSTNMRGRRELLIETRGCDTAEDDDSDDVSDEGVCQVWVVGRGEG